MHPIRRACVLASVACLGAAATPAQDKVDVVEPSAKAPRGKALEWKSAQGRPYWYRLPKNLDSKHPPDLVVMLHGTGLDHRWSFFNYPIVGDFRARDIVVSPDGLTPGGPTFNFVQGPKDGEQIAGLITDFKKRFPVGRVYLYGHSQGAFFCYWFAGEHPELVDGIVAHAGNLLGARHGKLAKQKVAIAILHGRADAVVPVECAFETEKIYRAQGYEKLKLEIVEGLTEQSGHWPLPHHVAKLLDWCDQVSTQSAAQALEIVAAELRREAPDLATIADQVEKARALLPKADDAAKKEVAPLLDALHGFLDKVMELHAQALLAGGEVLDPKATFGPWALHFTQLDAAFGTDAEWKKRFAKTRELAGRHGKAVDKVQKALDKNTKDARAAALRALEDAFLAADADALGSQLVQAFAAAKPADADGKARLDAVLAARAQARTDARKAVADTTRPALDELRVAAPALFAAGGDGAADGK